MDDVVARAEAFQRLHVGPRLLIVANAWDAASARVFEAEGMAAVGTGSAGVAFSHGHPDDERVPREIMLAAIGEITAAVRVPVTADILSGLGATDDGVAATIRDVIALGAVGVNIEDGNGTGLVDVTRQAERIRIACRAAHAAGVPIVVNARTDGYWLKVGDERQRLRASIDRANRYREAGAHCLFVPAVTDAGDIATLVREIDGPVNILAVPGCPSIPELEQLGVRRLSQGSGPMRATMMLTRRIARELLDHGTYRSFQNAAIPYGEANALFEPR